MSKPIYFLIAFLIFYVMVKRIKGENKFDTIMDSDSPFPILNIIATPLLWPLVLPAKLLWWLLDRIWNKFNKHNNHPTK